MRECRSAREFGDIFRMEVAALGGLQWDWKRDMKPWLAQMFDGARFGDPDFDWSLEAAKQLGREFVSEASSW